MWAKNLENSSRWEVNKKLAWVYDTVKTQELVKQIEEGYKITRDKLAELYRRQMQEQNNLQPKRQIPLSLEALEKSWLESNNFRVDSSKWEMQLDLLSWVEYLINPEWDIIELKVNWKKEQLFSQEAAIRETQKYSRKIPTKEQLEQMAIHYWQDWEKLSKELWLQPIGYWNPLKKKYYNDNSGFYWALDSNWQLGQSIFFDKNRILFYPINNTKNFLPVRCIRE